MSMASRGAGARACLGNGLQRAVQHLVGARDGIEVLRPHLAFKDQPTGDEVELLEVGCIEAHAFGTSADEKLPLRHVEAAERTVGAELGPAGGERRARRVEEAAAVAGDAVRIGDDDVGPLPATSSVPRSWLAWDGSVEVTSLRMMRAGVGPSCRIRRPSRPSCVWTAPGLLLRIRPRCSTLNCWYWLRLTPARLGGAMCTSGTPFCAASRIGRWPAGALRSATMPWVWAFAATSKPASVAPLNAAAMNLDSARRARRFLPVLTNVLLQPISRAPWTRSGGLWQRSMQLRRDLPFMGWMWAVSGGVDGFKRWPRR